MSEAGTTDSPASLVAIIVAARRAGDKDLERQARRELQRRFSLSVNFTRPKDRQGVAHDA